MTETIAYGLIAFAMTGTLVPAIRRWALRWNAVDIPNERSSHDTPTPRGGGIAIIGSILPLWLIAMTSSDVTTGGPFAIMLVGTGAIATVGLIDDLKPLSVGIRLATHLAVAIVAGIAGVRIESIGPSGGWVVASFGLSLLVTVLWIVGSTNAFNFMDGINGIASLQAIASGITFAALFHHYDDRLGLVGAVLVTGAAAGFLPWNFPTAKIFMGDVGSGALGFLLACLVCRLSAVGGTFIQGLLPLLPFLFDTGFTLCRRIANREKWWTPHRTHLYQRLAQLGWSHPKVSFLWFALASICGLSAVILTRLDRTQGLVVVAIVFLLHVGVAVAILRSSRRRQVEHT